MVFNSLHDEIIIINNLDLDTTDLFFFIKEKTLWDNSIASRKTASYGVPYNYSGINYSASEFPRNIKKVALLIEQYIGFSPNNCLINYYFKSESKMGFHSDQIEILDRNTGVAIVSLGSPRVMRFKNKLNKNLFEDILLSPNSLLYMSQKVQNDWLHSILPDKDNINSERISITFRKIKN